MKTIIRIIFPLLFAAALVSLVMANSLLSVFVCLVVMAFYSITSLVMMVYTQRKLEQDILLALNHSWLYGVQIAERIESATGKRVSTGSLYAALSRLKEKGFVETKDGERRAERGNLPRRYFRLTTEGEYAIS